MTSLLNIDVSSGDMFGIWPDPGRIDKATRHHKGPSCLQL